MAKKYQYYSKEYSSYVVGGSALW